MDSETGIETLLVEVGSFACLAVVAGVIIFAVRRVSQTGAIRGGTLLPRPRQRAVPWGLAQVGIVLLISLSWELCIPQLLPRRLGQPIYAAELIVQLQPSAANGLAAPVAGLPAAWLAYQNQLAERSIMELWLILPVRLLQVATLLVILLVQAGARPYQLGLTTHRWADNLLVGYLGWLILTPVVFLIFALVLQVWPAREYHEVELVLRYRPGPATWLVTGLMAVIVAPFAEELLVRGMLQRTMTANPRVADVILLSALFTAILWGVQTEADKGLSPAVAAVLFLVTVGPGYLVFEWLVRRWLPKPGAARSIYSASLIFAAMHGTWPTPFPLFFLSLGLGYLAYRTQSLLAPLVVHALFNATSLLPFVILQSFE